MAIQQPQTPQNRHKPETQQKSKQNKKQYLNKQILKAQANKTTKYSNYKPNPTKLTAK